MAQFMFPRLVLKKASKPNSEREKLTIPEDGELHLKNNNVVPSSVSVKEMKTDKSFSEAGSSDLKKNTFFLLPEDGVLFFSPGDSGRKVVVEYDWTETPDEDTDEQDENEEENEDEDDLFDSEEDEESSSKKKIDTKGKDNPWSLASDWFHYEPVKETVEINNSLKTKLQKGIDLRKGIRALQLDDAKKETGAEYKVRPGTSKTPVAGEAIYNYQTGVLHWPEEANGKKFRIEFFLPGRESKKRVELSGEQEYERIESFKDKASDLWTRIFMHPDPSFVADTLIPLVEGEIDAMYEKASGISSDEKREAALADVPDVTGEFIDLEHLLHKVEQDPSEDNKDTLKDFIRSEVSPKLSKMYSLAALISERIYDLQTTSEDEDLPEFGDSGARVLDLPTLKYMKGVRQEANSLEEDLVDFSKYYTALLLSAILDPKTYLPGSSVDSFRPIADVFDKAGIGIAELHSVALSEFRKSVLNFDREKRNKQEIPNPVDFRLHGSPLMANVRSSLRQMYNQAVTEVKEFVSRSGTKTVTVPEGGGRVELGVTGFRTDNLVVTGPGNKEFIPANANLMPTEDEARKKGEGKSPRVKIVVGPQPGRTSEISVIDPERNVKLEMAEGQAHTVDSKNKLKGNKDIFFFAPSSGIIWLDEHYRGKKLSVLTRGSGTEGVTIDKDEYVAYPESGVIEFSPKNSGDKVAISYVQKVRSKRFVTPTTILDENEESTSFVDTVADQDADPLSQELAALSEENVSHALDVMSDVLLTQEDPRLDEKDRALLAGILGIGQPNDASLSLPEIAAKEPFSGKESLSDMKKRRKSAVESLLSILREKAKGDRSLLKTLVPMKKVLLKGQDTEPDKILSFLRTKDPEVEAVKNLLNSVLVRISLKPDEENILRWMWGVPGPLRRDHLEEDEAKKLRDHVPEETKPAYNVGERLQEIAIDEFGAQVTDDDSQQEIVELVSKVYSRAVKKFSTSLASLMEKNSDLFSRKYPSFSEFFQRKHKAQSLAEEILQIESEEYTVDEKRVQQKSEERKKKEESQLELNKKPLFDQLKTSIPGVDEDLLKSLMQEAMNAAKEGKDFSTLLDKREKSVKQIKDRVSSLIEEKTKVRREDLLRLQDAVQSTKTTISSIDSDIEKGKAERSSIREKAIEEAGAEYKEKIALSQAKIKALTEILAAASGDGESLSDLLSPSGLARIESGDNIPHPDVLAIYQEYSSLYDADAEDLSSAREVLREDIEIEKETLKNLRQEAVSFSDKKTRSSLRKVNQNLKELESKKQKFIETLRSQESEVAERKEYLKSFIENLQESAQSKIREHEKSKELDLLVRVNDFLSDRPDLQRGDGTYSLENMFEIKKKEKTPGYTPPTLPEGEKDTYRPLPEKLRTVKDVRNPVEPKEPPKRKYPSSMGKDGPNQKRILEQYEGGYISAEEFLDSISRYKKNLPDAAISSLDRYESGTMSEDSAASAVADALKHYAEEKEETDKDVFAPRSKKAPEVKRSLLDELQAVAIQPDPDESKESYESRIHNFKILMIALRNHFKKGGDVRKFAPNLPPSQTLSDQAKVLKSVVKFLLDNAEDLRTGKGTWDLSGLQKPIRAVPLESLPGGSSFAPVDLSDRAKSAEQLHNAQPGLSKDEAEKLNDIIRMVSNGKPLSEIVKGLGRSKSIEGKGVLALATRLALFINRHSEIKTEEGWNFQSLYTGEHRLPSYDEVRGYFPLDAHLSPLVESLQKEMKEEAGPDGAIESIKDTRERVLDMLHRMSEFAMYDMSLEDMETEFVDMDKNKSTPYSYSYLFQKMRNFISRLSKTTPLSQMRNDYGLSPLFDVGTPSGSPSEQDEIDSVNTEVEEVSRWSNDFEVFVEDQDLTADEAETAHNILSSIQLKMSTSGKSAGELVGSLSKARPDLSPLIVKILRYIGKNKNRYESGVPGIPDLSSLTGLEFVNPYRDQKAEASDKEKEELKSNIFEDMVAEKELDDVHVDLFADIIRALKENPGIEGLERITKNSDGTDIEGLPEAAAKFLVSKGLVDEDGGPDARGIKLPPLKGRPLFVSKDGVPDNEAIMKAFGFTEEELQEEIEEFSDEVADMDDSMPEPGPEFVDDFIEEVRDTGVDVPPVAEEAMDFLSGEEAEGEEEPEDKGLLYRTIFEKMSNEFDFDEQERSQALLILRSIRENGVDSVLTRIKKIKPSLEVIVQDIVDYLNESGIPSADIKHVVLPEDATESTSEEEVAEEDQAFLPTFRVEVPDDMLRSILRAAQRAQKGSDLAVADFVRRMEGVIDRDTVKNAILQGIEEGFVAVQGTGATIEEGTVFIPVTEDGTPISSIRVLQVPADQSSKQEAPVTPAPVTPEETPKPSGMPEPKSRPRGRMPKTLVSHPVGVERYSFIANAVGITPTEAKLLDQSVGRVQDMTLSDLSTFWRSNKDNVSDEVRDIFQKYVKGLTTYLRLVQEGRDPLEGKVEPPKDAPAKRSPGEWRNDEATPKQVEKVRTLAEEISSLGENPVVVIPEGASKGEASDAINALKAQIEQIKETKARKPVPQTPPIAQPSQPTPSPSITLEKRKQLYDLAIKWLTAEDIPNASAFLKVLERKNRPDLVEAYKALIPKIQKALDAINADEIDIDLSGI